MKISSIFVVTMVVLAAAFVYVGDVRADSGAVGLSFQVPAAEPMCDSCGCTKPKEGEQKEEKKCCGKCGSEDGEKKECDKEKSGCDKEKSGSGQEAEKSGSGCGKSKGSCGAKK